MISPIKYLQIDGISVCFSPEKISEILSEVAKVSESYIQIYYDVNPSLLEKDPVMWYQTATQQVRVPLEWADTEQAYEIICEIKKNGFVNYLQGWTLSACSEEHYLVEPNWQIKHARVVVAYNVVSDDEDEYEDEAEDEYEDYPEEERVTGKRTRADMEDIEDDINTVSDLSLGSGACDEIEDIDNYIINVIEDDEDYESDTNTNDYRLTDEYCFNYIAATA